MLQFILSIQLYYTNSKCDYGICGIIIDRMIIIVCDCGEKLGTKSSFRLSSINHTGPFTNDKQTGICERSETAKKNKGRDSGRERERERERRRDGER